MVGYIGIIQSSASFSFGTHFLWYDVINSDSSISNLCVVISYLKNNQHTFTLARGGVINGLVKNDTNPCYVMSSTFNNERHHPHHHFWFGINNN